MPRQEIEDSPQNGITTQRRDLQILALYDCPVKNPRLFISELTYSESQDSASPLKTCTTPSLHFSVSLFKMNGLPSLHKCFPLTGSKKWGYNWRAIWNVKEETTSKLTIRASTFKYNVYCLLNLNKYSQFSLFTIVVF